jgi:hypothetical protein
MSGDYRSSSSGASGSVARSAEPRTIRTYPSSPAISRPAGYGDGGAWRSRSYLGRTMGGSSYGRSYGYGPSVRPGSSSSGKVSSGRVSSGKTSVSRGSSSGSRGSSGSHSSGGGSRKR